MGKNQTTGNEKYFVTNILQTVLIALLAVISTIGTICVSFHSNLQVARPLGPLIGIIFGLIIVARAASRYGETSRIFTIFPTIIGAALIISDLIVLIVDSAGLMGNGLLKETWYAPLFGIPSHLYVSYLGIRQRKKAKEPYLAGSPYEKHQKTLAHVAFLCLLLGGLIGAVANLFGFFAAFMASDTPRYLAILVTLMRVLSTIAIFGGAAAWICYTIFVVQTLNNAGRTTSSYNTKSRRGSRSSSKPTPSRSNTAQPFDAPLAMQVVAEHFTGDYDEPWRGCKITYSVSVTVNADKVDFLLKCDLSGTYKTEFEDKVMKNVEDMIKKKEQFIIDTAVDFLEKEDPTHEYLVSINLKTD